ncbi:hypothetical protein PAENIP36_60580 [Paenibacillus sp. P36]
MMSTHLIYYYRDFMEKEFPFKLDFRTETSLNLDACHAGIGSSGLGESQEACAFGVFWRSVAARCDCANIGGRSGNYSGG